MSAKVLVTGLANTGKTSLLKPLKNVLVFSRDGKPFSLELPHVNVPDYGKIDELLDLIQEKLDAYKTKMGEYPDTLVFDSVSRIFTDIETNCQNQRAHHGRHDGSGLPAGIAAADFLYKSHGCARDDHKRAVSERVEQHEQDPPGEASFPGNHTEQRDQNRRRTW